MKVQHSAAVQTLALISILCVLLPPGCHAQRTPASLRSEWGNLEGVWLFRTDPDEVGEREGWQETDFVDSAWVELRVPGCWEAQGVTDPRPGQPPKPRGDMPYSDYDGVAWYRLHFVVPAEWAGRNLTLALGSIDDEDRTYLNGALVGETGPGIERAVLVWRIYEVPAERVRFGQENVLAIRVFDGGGPGGFMGPTPSLLPKDLAEAVLELPPPSRPLPERMARPPADCRMLKIIHSWPDEPEAQDALIRSLITQGFGGVVCNVSFDQYLESEAKWQAFVRAVKAAKEAGMAMWLYDEHGYPSGTAGGIVLRDHPDWEARGLLVADTPSEGGTVTLDIPPGRFRGAAAYPVKNGEIDLGAARDLSAEVRDGKLSVVLPAGPWVVIAFAENRLYDNTHAALSLALKLPCTNLLMTEPTARFIEVTHEAYARHLGDDLGQWFEATFTDEPSLMSMFVRPAPYRPLPWAPDLPAQFLQRRGYDLLPVVPALVADAGPRGKRVRYDFWLTVGELVAERFFGQIQDWCGKHGLASGGHLLAEESIAGQVALYGDFLRCIRRLDAPSIDCLTSIPAEVPWRIARLISSAADLEERTLTMCETSSFVQEYRPAGDERPQTMVTEEQIRGTCNRLMLGGINTITSYYSFKGLDTAALRRLNLWVGRCCTLLRGGHQVTDIAVLYPTESLWPHFRPARSGATDSPQATQIEQTCDAVADALYTARRDFAWVDSKALTDAQVQGDALVHGNLRWRVVVLPGAETLPLAAWERLAQFWGAGGLIIAVGARPLNSDTEFPSPRVQEIANQLFGSATQTAVTQNAVGGAGVCVAHGAEELLPAVLDRLLEPDVSVADRAAPIRVTHRRVDGHEVYFLINDGPAPWSGEVTHAGQGTGEQWDPATGQMMAVEGGKPLHLDLTPYGGVLLRFPSARMPAKLRAEGAVLPGIAIQSLPDVKPEVGRGEFVTGGLEPATDLQSLAGATVWHANGTLTKGGVDTFLFASFRYAPPLDLRDAHHLVLETWVPEAQRTPAPVLVLLHDSDGGVYLADSGRPLSAPGHAETFVPLSRFQLGGWSTDPSGKLELEHVAAISIGWGGYFGREGERIKFSFSAPRVAKFQE